VARVLDDDKPGGRLWRLNPLNSLFVLISAKEPLTVRVDLDA